MYRRNLFVRFGLSKLASVKTWTTCEYDAKAMGKLNHKTILGSEFKKQFPKYKPMKVIGNNRRGFCYKVGINTNDEPFDPSGTCEGGGLYFTDETNISRYCGDYCQKIAVINLLDDEPIYIDGNKCKVNSFEITEMLEIRDWMLKLTNYDVLSSIMVNPYLIQYIDNPDVSVQMLAVKQNPIVIKHIANPDVSVQMEAIKHIPSIIRHITNPDFSVQMSAINANPSLIQHIANPNISVLMLALKLRIKNYFA